MLEAICVGDLHLDGLKKLYGDQANSLILAEFDKVCEWAVYNGIDYVIQLGDVFDKYRGTYNAHVQLLRLLYKWDGRLNILFLLGNHDYGEDGTNSVEILQEIKFNTIKFFTKSTQLELEGIICNFLCYPDTTPIKSSKQPINFAHWESIGATGDNGRQLSHGVKTLDKHVYVNGHLHTPHDSGNVHYVGTLFQKSFGEKPKKSFTKLQASYKGNKLELELTRIKVNPVIKLTNLTINSKADLADVDTDKFHKYRLLLKEGVIIPDSWLADHPNVVKCEGYTTKEELEALQSDTHIILDDDGVPLIDEKELLREAVMQRTKDEAKTERALNILSNLMSANKDVAKD